MSRLGRRLFALSLAVYLFTAGGSLTTTDAVVTFDVTRNLVDRGRVSMSGNLLGRDWHKGRDGQYYAPFGIAQSIYNVPWYLTAKAITAVTHVHLGKPDTIAKAVVALGQTVVGATIVWLLFRFAAAVTGNAVAAGWAALTFAFGSILWPYAKFGFNQPLACLTLLLAAFRAFRATREHEPRHAIWAGVWMAASILTRHEMAIGIVPIVLWLWLDRRPTSRERTRRVMAFAPGVIAGALIWLGYNYVRFGNPIDSGYLHDPLPSIGFTLGPGLIALLFSPSASLLLYSPVTAVSLVGLVTLWRRDRAIAMFLTSFVALFLLFYASLGNWLGGRSYGSRYLVVILPFLGIAFASLLSHLNDTRRRAVALTLLVGGLLVQLPGVMVDYAKVSQASAAERGAFTTEEHQWNWQASPLVLNTRALTAALPANAAYLSGRAAPPAVATTAGADDREFSQQFAFSLDFWWLYLFYLHALSRIGVAIVVAGFLAVIGLASRRVEREMRAVH